MNLEQALANRARVRGLLRRRQPEFASALESAVQEMRCPRCHVTMAGSGARESSPSADPGKLLARPAGADGGYLPVLADSAVASREGWS
jgi:hypothetical protein